MTRKDAYRQVQDRRSFQPVAAAKLPAGVEGMCFLHKRTGTLTVIGQTHLHLVKYGTTLRTVKFDG
jgi:hypothetical protein